jgi:hypothetical protein
MPNIKLWPYCDLKVTWNQVWTLWVFYCNIRSSCNGNERLCEMNYSWQHTPTLLWSKRTLLTTMHAAGLYPDHCTQSNHKEIFCEINLSWHQTSIIKENCCVILRFHYNIDENCAALGCYTVSSANSLPMFWDDPLGPILTPE